MGPNRSAARRRPANKTQKSHDFCYAHPPALFTKWPDCGTIKRFAATYWKRTRMNPAIFPILKILGGFVLLVVGGELLVRGAVKLAAAMKVSSLVIGLTVVSFGTSAPELAVSIGAAISGNADVAIGNVVGSNIFNVLFVLGASALIVPLVVSSQLVIRDVPLMIGASLLLWWFGWDGNLNQGEGAILFGGVVAYSWWCIHQSRRENKAAATANLDAPPAEEFSFASLGMQLGLIVSGLVLLGLGADWLIDGTVWCAKQLGVSELVIGLTVVAFGTSLPEVVTSLVAAWRGERDLAVGNVVGSNLFNILCVLGATSLFAPGGVNVAESAIRFDIPVMVAVAIACWPIFASGHLIARWEGVLFISYYFLYTTLVVLHATGHGFAHTLQGVTIFFLLPLTAITVGVSCWRRWTMKNT
jgi:cation:H+ antiporter